MQCKLTITKGILSGSAYQLRPPCSITMGRSSACEINLKKDLRLSRVHCQIEITDNGAFITDLNSSNGTFVNDQKIISQPLNNNDSIKIGSTTFVLEIELDKPEETDSQSAVEIAGYKIVEKIGEGGMGTVFKAIQVSMNRIVAFKVLNVREGDVEEAGKKFLREAQTGAKVTHGNIVRFYDCGCDKGLYYVVMEFIDGTPLDKLMENSPNHRLPFQQVVSIANQLCDALDYLYTMKLVHRDIKPANIILQEMDIAKLTDFGLAKRFQGSLLSGLTMEGEGKGTLIYMPPEQIDDALHADHRADIYSLGATMYHMLTGRIPFYGTTLQNLIYQVENAYPPKVHEINPEVPRKLSKVVEKCMQKDKNRRYQSAAKLKEALSS